MTRKIIQISAVSPGRSGDKGYHPAVLALADDGSVWGAGFNPSTKNFDPWEKLPALPATDQDAMETLQKHRDAQKQTPLTFWQQLEKRFLLR
ncbi:hypothetical protein [Stutzerimonas stutzeri]|uniref:Uncharacterized protein n=1 Tax=Stutzerimonas stutzeri TaxID=316 RepID=A0AA40RVD7_STUST|nr:hypothetical protein [Stutzerimonas stutzeri]MBA1306725.1 hypothetical protein [Stutzerimonas stutzeri]